MYKRKYIYLIMLIIAAFAVAILPWPAKAQSSPSFSSVVVDLWPEFDRPSILVIYHITLPSDTTLPAEVRLRIPAVVGEPNAVAAQHPDGSLFTLNYVQEEAGEWAWLAFQATTPELQVEYYDPRLIKNGDKRHFEFVWPGDYGVDAFLIQVQQPKGGSDMRTSPSMGSGAQAADGMVYYSTDVGPMDEGQSFSITVDYIKETEALSIESVPIEASGPLDDTATGRTTMTSALPYLLGGLGLFLIGGGAYWYWQSGQKKEQAPKQQRGSRRKSSESQPDTGRSAASNGAHIYCHQCGKRAASGDRFCRVCGTQLRIS